MCSDYCPCDKGEGQSNKDLWESYDESMLNGFTRTKKEESQTYIPFKWTGKGNGVNSFRDCYNTKLKDEIKKDKNKFNSKVIDFFDKKGFEFLGALESSFDCASICNVPLFYLTRDISEGRPTQECVKGVIDGI